MAFSNSYNLNPFPPLPSGHYEEMVFDCYVFPQPYIYFA